MSDTPAAPSPENNYHAYLLRVWRAGGDANTWQASLQDSKTSARLGFGSLEELFAFLLQATEARADAPTQFPPDKRTI